MMNTYDLGSSSKEWKDIYIDGTILILLRETAAITFTSLSVGTGISGHFSGNW